MRASLTLLRTAALAALILTLLVAALHSSLLWASAQLFFPDQANGSLVVRGGQVVGSRLIGQGFAEARYFHPRPSAAGDGYDGLASGGTNLGPMNDKLVSDVKGLAAAYREENGLTPEDAVPADAVMRSGSGLDPHVGVQNALLQADRVARARGLDPAKMRAVVEAQVEGPELGFWGDPRVNVLLLNLALDEAPSLASTASAGAGRQVASESR